MSALELEPLTSTGLADQIITDVAAEAWRPDPLLTVSAWADANRMLGSEISAEPGPWRTSRVPYLREIMDALSLMVPCHSTTFMGARQLGKTSVIDNFIGYAMDYAPAPIMFVEPSLDLAKRVSKQRIAPMIDSTPRLKLKVAERRSRDSGNTILFKEFDGGLLAMTGANSGSGLRAIPARFLLCDEIDAWPIDVKGAAGKGEEGEGDPLSIAAGATSTFGERRKEYYSSTPTIRGNSAIETKFLAGDQRRYYIPCPSCGYMDFLTWQGRDWVGGVPGTHHWIEYDEAAPQTARMVCSNSACGARVEERHKTRMLAAGEWRATAAAPDGVRSYHLSGLYSPLGWLSWGAIAAKFEAVKHDRRRLKAWTNTQLAETFEERGDQAVEPDSLLARAEEYRAEVPTGVGILVASVDVQGDRLEVKVKGYGAGEESWLIAWQRIEGDPAHGAVWLELDAYLRTKFKHESGQLVPIECTTVDTGGHHTDQVYRFCKARAHRNVYAIKGGRHDNRPLVERPSNRNSYRVKLYVLCVNVGKDIVYSRLRIQQPGPGYMHLPDVDWCDEEYIGQLTAEVSIRKEVKGRPGRSVRVWENRGGRNEALDLEVYALGALYIKGTAVLRNLAARAAKLAEKVETPPEGGAPPAPAPAPARRRSRWVDGWKR